MKPSRRLGQSIIEFTFVGIPMIFVLISIFEISRGMWVYSTLNHAVKEGVRFVIVHGKNCVNNPPSVTNNCQKSIWETTQVIQANGVGIDVAATIVTFKVLDDAGSVLLTTSCSMGAGGTTPCSSLTGSANYWPPTTNNDVNQLLRIEITTPFTSALAMFWPGSRPVNFATATLAASSTDRVQF